MTVKNYRELRLNSQSRLSFMQRAKQVSLPWWIGCLALVALCTTLLLQWCAACRSQEVVTSLILPGIGLGFGLSLLLWNLALPGSKTRENASYLVSIAALSGLFPVMLMLLGYHPCKLCFMVWAAVWILFLTAPHQSKMMTAARLTFLIGLVSAFGIWRIPWANASATSLFMKAGVQSAASENGPLIGSRVPESAGFDVPQKGVILFWTGCRCPLEKVRDAISVLHKQGVHPVIVTLMPTPLAKEWAPNSSVHQVGFDTFQKWGVDPILPHDLVWVEQGVVTDNQLAGNLVVR